MKKFHILLSLMLISINTYAAQEQKTDPFAHANELYAASNWASAYIEYDRLHFAIENGDLPVDTIEPMDLIRGHVNFGDVLYAHAASAQNEGNYLDAKRLMLDACSHWNHRLEGRQFGRAPLDNELDDLSDITGKRIAVYSERAGGAFGDSYYMSPLLDYLKEKGAHVIFIPQKPLANLYDRNHLPDTLQARYVDQVALRDTELPEHDKAIYLWSILKRYLKDETVQQKFPMKPCLSGKKFHNEDFLKKVADLTQKYGQEPMPVVMWYRSSGPASAAADWRTLDRDPGAHRMLSTVQNLPVIVINVEGLGHAPISEEEYKQRKETGNLGNTDMVDVTTYPTDNVFNFGPEFDREIPFGDTLGVMQFIKRKRGVLMGCDTGLLNAAAMIEKDEEEYPEQSVLAILNERADHRWGIEKTSPRNWHHSKDVLVFQAQEQSKWEEPLAQAHAIIKDRIKMFQQMKQQQK